MPNAVIFDFSGTLFHCADTEAWLRAALAHEGIVATEREIARYTARLHASGGQPGGHSEFTVPAELAELWERRDLTASAHRAAYTALMRRAQLPWAGIEDVLYDLDPTPSAWQIYPDTVAVLELLRDRGAPVAVLSNIAWDVRPIFKHFGIDHLITSYVLSYEVGVKKPDPEIFRIACVGLGFAERPRDVLMVGDNRVADGGATAIGCEFRLVEHLPVTERPRALLDAVQGVAGGADGDSGGHVV